MIRARHLRSGHPMAELAVNNLVLSAELVLIHARRRLPVLPYSSYIVSRLFYAHDPAARMVAQLLQLT